MIENEVIILRAVKDHINELVNYSLMEIQGVDPESLIMFNDMNQRRLFFILLVDFLSKTDSRGPIKQTTFLGGLANICNNPQFSINDSEQSLRNAVVDFRNWLREEKEIEIWMPSIGQELKIAVSRVNYLKMSGDASKHNYLRAIGVAQSLQKILEKAGVEVDLETALLALPDFYERFHDDILIYLSSHISEFLNNIRWGIYEYLQPEFQNSYHKTKENIAGYSFNVPGSIKSSYARDCYWDLMNETRRIPFMRKFIVSEILKEHY